MFKQSFYIIAIQIVGVILGFMSVYLVAGDMGPEIYSLVGVYGVVSGFILTFSHLGVETTMMREALYWMQCGDIEKVKEYTTQSIISRLIGFLLLLPLVFGYLLFLYYAKYESRYLLILISFYVGSCANALCDSMSLIVRSQGNYVFSQAVKTINSSIVKFIAIFVYILYGATPYLFFYCLIPIPLLLVFYIKLRNYLSIDFISIAGTIRKIKDSRNLWLNSYMGYFSNSADTLLVSVIFPPSLMGAYTLYKNLEGMARSFCEGFFDVIFQRFVKYRGDAKTLISMERKVNLTRWAVILLIVAVMAVFTINPSFFVRLINLTKYNDVILILYVVSLASILYLFGKNEGNLIALLGPSSVILKLGVVMFFVTLSSYLLVVLIPTIEGVLSQRLFILGISSLLSIFIFKKHRLDYFKNNYH